MLLAIDTAAGTDIALVQADPEPRILAQFTEPSARHHAELIGTGIATVLQDAGVTAAAVTEVVCGMGPGPFTGLRVGVAAARTFAFARQVPLRPLPSHDAVAFAWYAAHPEHTGALAVTTDARRRELAMTVYAGPDLQTDGFTLISPAELDDSLPAGTAHEDAAQISAGQLALAWLARRARGENAAPDEILYSRAPDAKPGAVPKRVTT